jgi:methylase of polypeptide subunit release factors
MSLPDIALRVRPERLAPLAERLRELGYEESAVSTFLGLRDISHLIALEYPAYLWRCKQDDSDLSKLISFFLLAQGTSRLQVQRLLGRSVFTVLKNCEIVSDDDGFVNSNVALYPCVGQFFFTDPWFNFGPQVPGKIYELGSDSYTLARVTARREGETALDLCTGSGVHAVASAQVCGHSTAVDINPRALEFTKLNAALNSVEVETQLGDLYAPVGERMFDLITANPPFVASPDPEILAHRSVGETGEEIPERLVHGLLKALRPGGLYSMILDYPAYAEETYLDRLERWLGETRGWGIAVLRFSEYNMNDFIRRHLGSADYVERFESYLESYAAQGIVGMESAHVFIHRFEEDHPNWKVLHPVPWPLQPVQEIARDWVQGLITFKSPSWTPDLSSKPCLNKRYKSVWRNSDDSQGMLEVASALEFPTEALSADELALALRLEGNKDSLEELLRSWVAQGRTEESFKLSLKGLGLRGALSQ